MTRQVAWIIDVKQSPIYATAAVLSGRPLAWIYAEFAEGPIPKLLYQSVQAHLDNLAIIWKSPNRVLVYDRNQNPSVRYSIRLDENGYIDQIAAPPVIDKRDWTGERGCFISEQQAAMAAKLLQSLVTQQQELQAG